MLSVMMFLPWIPEVMALAGAEGWSCGMLLTVRDLPPRHSHVLVCGFVFGLASGNDHFLKHSCSFASFHPEKMKPVCPFLLEQLQRGFSLREIIGQKLLLEGRGANEIS